MQRLKNLQYIKKEIILILDLILSTVSTFLAYIFILSLFHIDDKSDILINCSLVSAFVSMILFLIFGLYKETIRNFTIANILKLIYIVILKCGIVTGVVYMWGFTKISLYGGLVDLLLTSFVLIVIRVLMITVYHHLIYSLKTNVENVFIYSTFGSALAQQLNSDVNSKYRVKGFLTTNKKKIDKVIVGQKVYYTDSDDAKLKKIFNKHNIRSVIFTSRLRLNSANDFFIDFCLQNNISIYLVGGICAMNGKLNIKDRNIKPIQIEDLLNRKEISIDTAKISAEIDGKVVMITGAAGSIGSEIATQIASFKVKHLILFDLSETPLHTLQLKLTTKFPNVNMVFILGDVRSTHRINAVIGKYKPSIIFHAAAYKHVPMIESNPCEGALTNVWGTINMAKTAVKYGVEKFVMVSTDKAVNPTNTMGASKRIAEMCVQSMSSQSKTQFITTRFGNVLGSNGSVIPLFKDQIAMGGPITVTHPDIIRYFMTIPEACKLVLQAATMGHTGEILVFDMGDQVSIVDLAKKMIQLSGFEPDVDIKIIYTGLRPGEKLYEELLSSEETTLPTIHKKIRVAQSIVIDQKSLDSNIRSLIVHARAVNVAETIKTMKQICPEYISKNSEFEIYDNN